MIEAASELPPAWARQFVRSARNEKQPDANCARAACRSQSNPGGQDAGIMFF